MSLQNITLSQGAGQAAVGTILSVATGSPQTYRPVGNVGNMKWGMKVKSAEVSNQGTQWTQYIPTMIEGGKFNADIRFQPSSVFADSSGAAGHDFTTGLGLQFQNRVTLYWRLVFPDGKTVFFIGYIEEFPIGLDFDKEIDVNLTIQISGPPQLV